MRCTVILIRLLDPTGSPLLVIFSQVGSLEKVIGRWQEALPSAEIMPISAMEGTNLTSLLDRIKEALPVGPPLYPNDTLTDRPQRFFASEIIR